MKTSLAALDLPLGAYPERAAVARGAIESAGRLAAAAVAPLRRVLRAELPPACARAFDGESQALRGEASLAEAVMRARRRLAAKAYRDAATGAALALAGEAMSRTLGVTPYPTQRLAAWCLLQGGFVEMATGEGKTLATGLAAAVAGLAGWPVHVLTANDYLVQRDRDHLAPFFAALGLGSAAVTGATPRPQRVAAWRHPVVYATAREVAFDYLRDHATLGGARDDHSVRGAVLAADGRDASAAMPVVPGLHCAILDEADSLLLDEAVVPLILAAPGGALDIAAYEQAYALAGELVAGRDFHLQPGERAAPLTEAGRGRVADALRGARGVLAQPRRAAELVEAALAARHAFRREHEYAVTDDGVVLIDGLTGRIATGRRWQGALHPMVEIKEGLRPCAPSATFAQLTYQRFFPRYLHLCGMSGTLLEARTELRMSYGAAVQRVPRAQPDRRQWLGERVFVDRVHKLRALTTAVRALHERGRPVLIGTDSVAESNAVAELLRGLGIAHQLLHATQDADEAARVARAGRAGAVTVATNIAGRGTDIRIDDAARAAGGLHVIALMRNRSPRIDRQLAGRAGRQGDPGSDERLLALDDALLAGIWPAALLRAAARSARHGELSKALGRAIFDLAQRVHGQRDRARRRDLRDADRHAREAYGFAGALE